MSHVLVEKKTPIYEIEGGISFKKITQVETEEGIAYTLPEIDSDYKYITFTDELSEEKGMFFAFISKDAQIWEVALEVKVNGEIISAYELARSINEK